MQLVEEVCYCFVVGLTFQADEKSHRHAYIDGGIRIFIIQLIISWQIITVLRFGELVVNSYEFVHFCTICLHPSDGYV